MVFHMLQGDNRKKEFVAFRMEAALLEAIREEAERKGLDLSATIRELCQRGLNEGDSIDNW